MSKIPPEAFERLSMLDACLERLRRSTRRCDPELVEKVRQVRKLAAQFRSALKAARRCRPMNEEPRPGAFASPIAAEPFEWRFRNGAAES